MQLATTVTSAMPAKTTKETTGVEALVPGDQLKIELGPEQELNVECPSGKRWLVTVKVHIVVTDV